MVSWRRHLAAANRSSETIRAYLDATTRLEEFLTERGMPLQVASLRREHVEAFIERQLKLHKPATAQLRYKSLQQFFRWLMDEGEITTSPMERMTPPKVVQRPPDVLSPTEVKQLLGTCDGSSFDGRRDTAIMTTFYDTGLRVSELVGLKLRSSDVPGSDVDLDRQLVFVVGKGDRARAVPIGAKAVKALDRYERLRATHPFAALPDYWVGSRGRLTVGGVQGMLARRAALAGIPHVNPHRLRHTFAHSWLVAGGNEGDLMALTGWQSRDMLSRYAASTAAERARESHKRLSPADKL